MVNDGQSEKYSGPLKAAFNWRLPFTWMLPHRTAYRHNANSSCSFAVPLAVASMVGPPVAATDVEWLLLNPFEESHVIEPPSAIVAEAVTAIPLPESARLVFNSGRITTGTGPTAKQMQPKSILSNGIVVSPEIDAVRLALAESDAPDSTLAWKE